ncbi:MAG: cupin domain-containing protein [Burkholderiales bacterium]|nr:MAG: cupin domain-containing protein [Betaproteobacteria bacterium]TAG84139.1 MAG: cupin domain-containing protein [Burkholderiales bacterium]
MNERAAALKQKLIRNLNTAAREPFVREPLYQCESASMTQGTIATKLGCAFDIVPAGKQSCPYHLHHAQEEMFVIIEGEGTLRVAGERIAISAGDVITIPPGPDYPHHILNTSEMPLKYLSISTREAPEICEYPDSHKVSAWAPNVGLRGRKESSLDYWDGEP